MRSDGEFARWWRWFLQAAGRPRIFPHIPDGRWSTTARMKSRTIPAIERLLDPLAGAGITSNASGTSGLQSLSAASRTVLDLRRRQMKNPLDSLWGTVISGLILTVILYVVVKNILS